MSLSVTSFAAPGPSLDTVIVNPMSSPAETVPSSAVLSIFRSGHSTVVESLALSVGWLLDVALATFGYSAHDAAVVSETMCTLIRAAGGEVDRRAVQRRRLAIEQIAGPLSIDQSMPAPMGSGSLSTTPLAVPGPALETVIVKPIGSPAEPCRVVGLLVSATSGHWTSTESSAVTRRRRCRRPPSPSLSISPHDANVVGELMCTDVDASVAEVPNVARQLAARDLRSRPAVAGRSTRLRPALVGSVSDSVTSWATRRARCS